MTTAVVILLAGCFSTGANDRSRTTTGPDGASASANADGGTSNGTSSDGATGAATNPDDQPTSEASPAVPPVPTSSRPATPEPVATPLPTPTLTPVAKGTVVAQGDVASPKGSIHFHYRVVSDGDNTFSAQFTGFTSTVPVPIGATFLQVAPKVGDGLTYLGVADHGLGGPATAAAPLSTASFGDLGKPSSLGTLVTYSKATSTAGIPTELGPNKVLAVTSVGWNIPVRQSNVHPIDHGPRAFATGTVTAKTPAGAPRAYRVSGGDTTAMVAARFGVSVDDLIWLNKNLQVFGEKQYLFENTTINLDPDRL